MKKSMNPAFTGKLSSTVRARDKEGNPLQGYHQIPESKKEWSPAQYEKFKRDNHAYFQSEEHVSNGPFANNFGSIPNPVASIFNENGKVQVIV